MSTKQNGQCKKRVMGVNYESGSGFNKFQYDVTMYGPITGIVFRF
jgi:hypothetical protein